MKFACLAGDRTGLARGQRKPIGWCSETGITVFRPSKSCGQKLAHRTRWLGGEERDYFDDSVVRKTAVKVDVTDGTLRKGYWELADAVGSRIGTVCGRLSVEENHGRRSRSGWERYSSHLPVVSNLAFVMSWQQLQR